MKYKIILGTASKYRKKVFEEMGYTNFEVMAADIDEKAIHSEDPKKLAMAIAAAKADELQKKINESALLITADQVVVWKGEIREKPRDEEEARLYLHTYHEAPAETVSAVTVTNTETGKRVTDVDVVKIVFEKIPEEVIDHLIENGDIFTKAGGFSIDDSLLQKYVRSIEGTKDSIRGFPRELVERLLEQARI